MPCRRQLVRSRIVDRSELNLADAEPPWRVAPGLSESLGGHSADARVARRNSRACSGLLDIGIP